MKRRLAMVSALVLVLLFSRTAAAIYFLPGEPPLTQADKTAAVTFFNNLKFDVSQAAKGTVRITLPKAGSSYSFWIITGCFDKDGAAIPLSGGNIYSGTGGTTISQNIVQNYMTGWVITFYNIKNNRVVSVEYFRYFPGQTTVQHPDSADLKIPVKDKEGKITEWINVAGKKVTAPAGDLSSLSSGLRFPDLYPGYWALEPISILAGANYLRGYPDGTFKPENRVTRAEFMVMLGNILLEKYPAGRVYDHRNERELVPSGHWSAGQAGETLKYMADGEPARIFKDKFNPDQDLTREEAAAVLASALAAHRNFSSPLPDNVAFSDLDTSTFPDSVRFAARHGLVAGYPDDTFRPKAPVTRAEIAAVLVKMLGKL